MSALSNALSQLTSQGTIPLPTASNSTGSSGSSSALNTADPFASLSSSQFIKIMMTELQQQDPLQPASSSDLLNQVSSLRNIESQLSLQQALQSLVLQSQVAQAGGLIGKMVSGLDANNNKVSGIVTSVVVQNGQANLQLDSGATVTMANLTQISSQPVQNTSTPAAASTSGTGGTGSTPTSPSAIGVLQNILGPMPLVGS
jgi:flagellar basal-body rod modification protein FlgD